MNGDLRNVENLADIDGTIVGGVSVSVVNGFGTDSGRLILKGDVTSLEIGGQEMWIDHICFERLPPLFRIALPIVLRGYPPPE